MTLLLKTLSRTAVLVGLTFAPIAVVAQANCPTAGMLDGDGIRFTQSNGDYEIHRLASNGAIVQEAAYGDLKSLNYIAHGVHVLQLSDLENGVIIPDSFWQFAFPMPIDELPIPVAGGSWNVRTTAIFNGDATSETIRHRWGAMTIFTIGGCTLNAIPVTAKYRNADESHTEEVMYFPDLGTAVLTSYTFDGARDEYTYVAVRGE